MMLLRPTFVQVSLKLVELGLLQTDVQMKHMAVRGAAGVRPLARHIVRLLHRVRRARADRGGQSLRRGGEGEESRETNHCAATGGAKDGGRAGGGRNKGAASGI